MQSLAVLVSARNVDMLSKGAVMRASSVHLVSRTNYVYQVISLATVSATTAENSPIPTMPQSGSGDDSSNFLKLPLLEKSRATLVLAGHAAHADHDEPKLLDDKNETKSNAQ